MKIDRVKILDKTENKKSKFSFSTFLGSIKALIPYLIPYKRYLVWMFIALLFTSCSILLMSQSIRFLVDHGLSSGDNSAQLYKGLILMMILVTILAFCSAARFFLITYVGEKITADIRTGIYNKLLELSPSFFEVNKSGELISRLTADTTLIQQIISSSLSVMMRNAIMLFGGIVMLCVMNLKLTLIAFCAFPFIIIPILMLGRKMRALSKEVQELVGELSGQFEETIHHIKTIQAYGSENFERKKFSKLIDKELFTALLRIKSRSILAALVIFLSFGIVVVMLWVGGLQVLHGHMSGGELSGFVFLSILCALSGGALIEVMNNINNAFGAVERINAFLKLDSDIYDVKGAKTIAELKLIDKKSTNSKRLTNSRKSKNIDDINDNLVFFDNVTFYYPLQKNRPAIKNMTLGIRKGEVVAIVGQSGAGKSTIFQLLLRFYDVSSGSIFLHGHNIKEIKLSDLRHHFAYVSQDISIFSRTISENIAYGKNDDFIDANDVMNVARDAAAMDFIEKLSDGLNTFVGEKGVRLSGGQKQRLVIARAMLKNAEILLLDEATSALDNYNEQLVQKAMEKVMQNKTTIIIAHRTSTIKNADKVVVLKNGEIVECGTYDELLKNNGEYVKFVLGKISKN